MAFKQPKPPNRKPLTRRQAIGAIVLLVALGVISGLGLATGPAAPKQVPLSQILAQADAHQLRSATLNDDSRVLTVTLNDGTKEQTGYANLYGISLTNRLLKDNVKLTASSAQGTPLWPQLLSYLPFLAVAAVLFWYLSSRGGIGGFSGKRGKVAEVPKTRFSDVAGVDEAVEELREIVDFFHDPKKFTKAGARPPKGFLLYGPPGTGKTLLARAVAGEAGVPFFSISGSDFVEMFVGVGAKRVRDIFDRARKAAPSIVFIDEIDSIGKARSGGKSPGNDERENTLNMLLAEMDGFDQSAQVVMMGATNMPEALDSALRRPGRFDREIPVPVPDVGGREKILALEAAKPGRHLDPVVNLAGFARRTFGLTGAELAQVMNEAAMETARRDKTVIGQGELDAALATTVLGRERRSAVVTEADRTITAWHEAGHTVAALTVDGAQRPVTVSIVPRGPAGGVTWMSGTESLYLRRSEAAASLVVSLAGRAAEERLLGGDFTQGAQGDLTAATDLATKMVTAYGMGSATLLTLSGDRLGFGAAADAVNAEVDQMLRTALEAARACLDAHGVLHEAITKALLAGETLDADQLAAISGAVAGGADADAAAAAAHI